MVSRFPCSMFSIIHKLNPTATKPCTLWTVYCVYLVFNIYTLRMSTQTNIHSIRPFKAFDFDVMDDERWTKNNDKKKKKVPD